MTNPDLRWHPAYLPIVQLWNDKLLYDNEEFLALAGVLGHLEREDAELLVEQRLDWEVNLPFYMKDARDNPPAPVSKPDAPPACNPFLPGHLTPDGYTTPEGWMEWYRALPGKFEDRHAAAHAEMRRIHAEVRPIAAKFSKPWPLGDADRNRAMDWIIEKLLADAAGVFSPVTPDDQGPWLTPRTLHDVYERVYGRGPFNPDGGYVQP